jgi:predicted O-methyltransferase YrrM
MFEQVWSDVDDFFTQHLLPSDDVLRATLETNVAEQLPPIAVTPPQGKLLHLLARACGARRILEIGTLGGYSTIWLARGMRAGGRLITLELDPAHAAVAETNLKRAGLESVVEVLVGSALDALPRIAAEGRGPFDLIFIDADKANIPTYFEWAVKLSRPGALIIVDNVVRDGNVIDGESSDASIRGVRRFVEMLADRDDMSGTAIQTVGTKGYDGFAIVRVGS